MIASMLSCSSGLSLAHSDYLQGKSYNYRYNAYTRRTFEEVSPSLAPPSYLGSSFSGIKYFSFSNYAFDSYDEALQHSLAGFHLDEPFSDLGYYLNYQDVIEDSFFSSDGQFTGYGFYSDQPYTVLVCRGTFIDIYNPPKFENLLVYQISNFMRDSSYSSCCGCC